MAAYIKETEYFFARTTAATPRMAMNEPTRAASTGAKPMRLTMSRLDSQKMPSRCMAMAPRTELEAFIVKGEGEFWQRVLDRNPPPITQISDVGLKYPNAIASPVHATAEIEELAGNYADLKRQIKELTSGIEPLQCAIAEYLGAHDTLLSAEGNPLLYFKNRATTSLDTTRLKKEEPSLYDRFARRGTTRAMTLPKE